MRGITAIHEVLTPARWATWVGQRHEWSGFLWLRWSDAEAVLLFVGGRPRIHLSDPAGWVEADHALAAIAQRLALLPPRWGDVPLPAAWAEALAGLSLMEPAVPAGVVDPGRWAAWAARRRRDGVAVVLSEHSGGIVVVDGQVYGVRFARGAVLAGDGSPFRGEGLVQIAHGTVNPALLPAGALPLFPASVEAGTGKVPGELIEAGTGKVPGASVEAGTGAPLEMGEPGRVGSQIAQGSLSAPADGDAAVEPARSERPRRFRGDETFLLAPAVDQRASRTLSAALGPGAPSTSDWLLLFDGSHTLDEIAQATGVPPEQVEQIVGRLVERRLVFRYRARRRGEGGS